MRRVAIDDVVLFLDLQLAGDFNRRAARVTNTSRPERPVLSSIFAMVDVRVALLAHLQRLHETSVVRPPTCGAAAARAAGNRRASDARRDRPQPEAKWARNTASAIAAAHFSSLVCDSP